jgi:carbon-monoxide dehydrogenase large subunit
MAAHARGLIRRHQVDGASYFVRGSPDRVKTIQAGVCARRVRHAVRHGTYFDETSYYDTELHLAVRDPHRDRRDRRKTGKTELVRYVAVDDVGNKINPMIVDGQLHGGIAQGVGQALWEGAVYSDEGQLLTGSMLDYALPRAAWFPNIELDETVTPSPVNPIGVKGVGEAGAIASTAAVANAVVDALSPLGIRHLDMPYSNQTVWRAIQSAKGGQA